MSTVHAELQEIIASGASEGSWVGMSTLLDLDRQIIKLKGRISGFMMQPQQDVTVRCSHSYDSHHATEIIERITRERLTLIVAELRDIQGRKGNWNMNDYMCGLFNGLELAVATLENREPDYRTIQKPAPRVVFDGQFFFRKRGK